MLNFLKKRNKEEFQLVLQFPGNALKDFDQFVSLENELTQKLGSSALVDGNDFGQGIGNIFIITTNPEDTFKSVKKILKPDFTSKMRAGLRKLSEETYKPIWPLGSTAFELG